MAKYIEPKEGEWVRPIRKGYKMACCDCGLVHKLDFSLMGKIRKYIIFRAFRDDRATGFFPLLRAALGFRSI